MKSSVFWCVVMSVCAVGILNAGIISVNFDDAVALPGTMEITDLAGAPGIRVGNWNNWLDNDTTLGDESQTIIDDSGATVAQFTATISPSPNWTSRDHNHDNDQEMFSDVIDVYGATYAVTASNVPYSAYHVYVYMRSDGSARAGSFAIGDTTYYARGGLTNPAADGTGYVLSSDTTLGDGTDIDQGNYVVFTGLSGSSFTLNLEAVFAGDSANPRNKVAGFQIVEVPEPATLALLGLGAFALLKKK